MPLVTGSIVQLFDEAITRARQLTQLSFSFTLFLFQKRAVRTRRRESVLRCPVHFHPDQLRIDEVWGA